MVKYTGVSLHPEGRCVRVRPVMVVAKHSSHVHCSFSHRSFSLVSVLVTSKSLRAIELASTVVAREDSWVGFALCSLCVVVGEAVVELEIERDREDRFGFG